MQVAIRPATGAASKRTGSLVQARRGSQALSLGPIHCINAPNADTILPMSTRSVLRGTPPPFFSTRDSPEAVTG